MLSPGGGLGVPNISRVIVESQRAAHARSSVEFATAS
jgi:hypothetical protein